MSSLDKIKKLLSRQQCVGASKAEEISCFKKAMIITLKEDIQEIDLDRVVRHLYKLGYNFLS